MFRCHVTWAIFRRNVISYFSGMLGYLFIVVFVVSASSMAYTSRFFANNVATLDQLNEVFPLLLLFIVPAITMSAWADEKKLGTEELLFTLPATDVEILLGKYFSVLAVYSVALGFSLFQLPVLGWYSDPDWGLLFATYFGYWLAGAALLSAGMFASALTSSVTVAFVLGVALCAIPVFMREIVGMFAFASDWPIFSFLGYLEFDQLSLSDQFREFGVGVIPLGGLVYFVSLTAFMLYLNHVVITKRHWSGDQKANMRLQYVARTICLVVILTSANVITRASADSLDLRADLTADNAFTLSDTTRELLNAVDEKQPVTIQAFISKDVPQEYVSLRKRLVGLLQQYNRIGGKDVQVRIVNVGDAYSREAVEGRTLGITKQQVQSERGGRLEISEFYLGAVISSPFGEVTITTFSVDAPLEYELTRSVRTVSGKKKRTIAVLETDAGVIGGFDRASFRSQPAWQIVDELRKQYTVKKVNPDQPYDEQPDLELLRLDAEHQKSLDEGKLSDKVRGEFSKNDVALSSSASVEAITPGSKWRVTDDANLHRSLVVKQDDQLVVFGSFDVLIAVLPSALTQPQMVRFVDAIEAGQPTLIFDDPMPMTIGLQHAPMVPKRPAGGGGMFGGGRQPPPVPRADGGKATTLMKALGIMWDSGFPSTWDGELVIVFDNFNPHPRFEQLVPPEFVFISPESGVSSAFNKESKITGGLKQVLALWPGRIKRVKDATKLEFEPLLRTGVNSGELEWGKMVDQNNPFAGPQPKRNPDRFRDEEAHTLAAHIHSDNKRGGINVVYVADLDIISDFALFRLAGQLRQRGFDYELQLDNVNFVLNSVDMLAGDEKMIDLRNRKARMRPLTEIQKEVNGFRKERQKAEESSQKEWENELKAIQQQLDDAQEKLGDESGGGLQQLFTAAETATRQLNQKKREIEQEQEKTLDRLKGEERQQINSLETRIRWQAVLLPPIPAIILGILVLGIRLYREESTIKASRSVKK